MNNSGISFDQQNTPSEPFSAEKKLIDYKMFICSRLLTNNCQQHKLLIKSSDNKVTYQHFVILALLENSSIVSMLVLCCVVSLA